MTSRPWIQLLEAGSSSLVVGVVDPDGEPFATRAWGLEALSEDPLVLRVLLQAGSLGKIGFRPGEGSSFKIAITAADVPTLESLQVKGVASDLAEATPEDRKRSTAYRHEFFDVINRTDGFDPRLLARWGPIDLLRCVVEVHDVFDQTPGPGAGARLHGLDA